MSDEHLDNINEEMFTGDEESYDLDKMKSTTPSVNPVKNQSPNVERDEKGRSESELVKILTDALQQAVKSIPATTTVSVLRRAPIKELRKYGATEFSGLKGVDPSIAENWMESTKRWFDILPENQITWDLFQKEFQKKYIGEMYIEDKKQEFLTLQQGDMSVIDYEREFSRLSRYTSEFIPTEADSCKKFLLGLRDEIKLQLVSQRITEFVDLIERAKMVEQVLGFDKKSKTSKLVGKCMGTTSSNPLPKRSRDSQKSQGKQTTVSIGSVRDHYIKDCPKNDSATLVTSQRSISIARGRGSGRGGSVSKGGGMRRGNDIVTQQSEARVPARAYVVRTHKEGDTHDVVTGIFLLYSEPVYALIDLGSSHSYINSKLVESGKLKSEISRVSIEVSSLLGQTVLVNQVCPRCSLIIQNKTFPVDLLIMPFVDFDIILGMDWLSEHNVILDCYKKRFSIQTASEGRVEVNGIRTSGPARIVSAIKGSKLLQQGCSAYLAYVINSDSVGSQCGKIQTVSKFPDVFPEELSGLPLDREVKFTIEVYLGTAPISIPPYRMSPTKLKELKI
ncbi:uncharacterized protein LOC108459261 [Gossypium arboreum]|uniref:uncharacterized protein LOC108459261 n=1 Tax=Gossypium arboreum TaxID=29729 RepID=UPI0022F1D9D3|nr:uncharacterized protein LOC108459261 [Gossypium arboreum]